MTFFKRAVKPLLLTTVSLVFAFNSLAQQPKLDQQIRSIFQDSKGVYWFGTNNSGVYRYDNKTLTQFSIGNGLADNQVLSIQEDQNGQLWFGTDKNGLFRFDGAKFYRFDFQ